MTRLLPGYQSEPTSATISTIRIDTRRRCKKAIPPMLLDGEGEPPHRIVMGLASFTMLFWPSEGGWPQRMLGARVIDLLPSDPTDLVRLGVMRARLAGLYPDYDVSIWERGPGVSGHDYEWVRRLPA